MRLAAGLRRLRAELCERAGWNRRARAQLDGSRALLLMYHRVLPESQARREAVEPGMYVTPESFAGQLDWLQEHFEILPLHEITARLADARPLPPGACALTFDDGWRDNLTHALPPLVARGLPATLFVVTARVGSSGGFWPDEVCRRLASRPADEARSLARSCGASGLGEPRDDLLAHLKSLPETARAAQLEHLRTRTEDLPEPERALLDWNELDDMARAGVDIESHGETHAILTGVAPEQVDAELRSARRTLEARGHGRHALLAYPSGAHHEGVRRSALAIGYRAAVTTEVGLVDAASDPLRLPRLGVHQGIAASRAEFLFKVPGAAL